MKKLLALILIVIFSFSFASCSNTDNIKESIANKVLEKISEKEAQNDSSSEKETEYTSSKESSTTSETTVTSTQESTTEETSEEEKPSKSLQDFITLREIKDIDSLNKFEWIVQNSTNLDAYTGESKKAFVRKDNSDFEIRVPQIISNDEKAQIINQALVDSLTKMNLNKIKSLFVDYDATISEDILSLRVLSETVFLDGTIEPLNTILGVNFDISSGEAVYISSREMLDRQGAKVELVEGFIAEIVPDLYNGFNPLYENKEVDLDKEIELFGEAFKQGLESDTLSIWKNSANDYYSMSLIRPIESANGYKYYYDITLADSAFKMAMLTRPRNALGIIYKATESEKMPSTSIYGSKVVLNDLDDGDGQIVYVASFGEDDSVGIYDLKYDIFDYWGDNTMFAPRIIPKDFIINNDKDAFDIYRFHTMLAETIPFEAVTVKASVGEVKYLGLDTLYDDMRYGSKLQYIYPSNHIGDFEKTVSGKLGKIRFKDDLTFEVVDEESWMEDLGFYARKGTYTSDYMYYYLYPSKEDLENGASEMLVFKKEKRDKISFYYDSGLKKAPKSFKLTYEK